MVQTFSTSILYKSFSFVKTSCSKLKSFFDVHFRALGLDLDKVSTQTGEDTSGDNLNGLCQLHKLEPDLGIFLGQVDDFLGARSSALGLGYAEASSDHLHDFRSVGADER